jgi:ATP-dependent DNA helicase RecG
MLQNNMKQLEQLIATGEGYQLEFKESIDKSLAKEVCAFANTDGGILLIGVTDAGKIKPLNITNELKSRVQDTINQIEPKIRVEIVIHEDGILQINIPKGANRPYSCSDGFYVRIGPNSQKLGRNEIIELFQSEGLIQFDKLEHQRADFLSDFDRFAYHNFLTKAKISNQIEPEQLLKNLGCLTDNNKFTNVGVLFFSKSIDFLLNHAVCSCILFNGTERVNILDRKNYNTNMLDNIDNAVNFVKAHTTTAYKIEKIQREEIHDVPEIALREAIVNAFCHRNYFQEGANIAVEIFADRVVVVSPGGLPSGLHQEEFGYKSVRRNHLIADLLARAGYIEKAGTGIGRIRQDAEQNHCPYEINYTQDWFTVTFYRQSSEKLPSNVHNYPVNHDKYPVNYLVNYLQSNKIQNMYSDKQLQNLAQILNLIAGNEYNRIKLAELTGLSVESVKKYIAILIDFGLIEFVGAAKNGYYKINNLVKQIGQNENI